MELRFAEREEGGSVRREREIVRWVARLGAVSVGQIGVRFGVSRSVAYELARRLVAGGLLERTPTLAGDPTLISATTAGITYAGLGLPPATIRIGEVDHWLACADVALELERRFGADRVLTDRELRLEERLTGKQIASAKLGETPNGLAPSLPGSRGDCGRAPNGLRGQADAEVAAAHGNDPARLAARPARRAAHLPLTRFRISCHRDDDARKTRRRDSRGRIGSGPGSPPRRSSRPAFKRCSSTRPAATTSPPAATRCAPTRPARTTSPEAGALSANTTGNENMATGVNALLNNTEAPTTSLSARLRWRQHQWQRQPRPGGEAGLNLTTGSDNIDIANPGVAGESGTIRIGDHGTQTAAFIAGVRGTTLGRAAQPVVVRSTGKPRGGAVAGGDRQTAGGAGKPPATPDRPAARAGEGRLIEAGSRAPAPPRTEGPGPGCVDSAARRSASPSSSDQADRRLAGPILALSRASSTVRTETTSWP